MTTIKPGQDGRIYLRNDANTHQAGSVALEALAGPQPVVEFHIDGTQVGAAPEPDVDVERYCWICGDEVIQVDGMAELTDMCGECAYHHPDNDCDPVRD